MTPVDNRSVIALAERARCGLARRTILRMILASMFAAVVVAWRTAGGLSDREGAAARSDHLVTAILTNGRSQATGRSTVRTILATWTFPSGVTHREVLTTPVADESTVRTLWVDSSGLRTPGRGGAGMVVAGSAVLTLVICGLTGAAAAVTVPAWRRHRLRITVEARWSSLVHHWWQDI
jgi:hypothetical protein